MQPRKNKTVKVNKGETLTLLSNRQAVKQPLVKTQSPVEFADSVYDKLQDYNLADRNSILYDIFRQIINQRTMNIAVLEENIKEHSKHL